MKAKYNFLAFVFIGTFGAISHFIYEWSGENKLLGYFFATNESTWEHLKLLFFPTLIFSLVEYFFVKNEVLNYIISVAISVLVGMISIIVLYNTYYGFLGYNIDFINITIFYIALIIMLIIKNKIIESGKFEGQNSSLFGLFICFFITLLFIFLTYNPPSLAVFLSPTK